MKKLFLSMILILGAAPEVFAYNTWFIRTDGGTRYSANVTTGQCDGLADAAYPGSGVNQPCAFKDFRYMWDDGTYGNYAWVISGGDTVVIEGCSAASDQQNPSNPACRIGWDTSTGSGSAGWCAGSQPNDNCFNPTIPSGTSGAHTRILGKCAYAGNCTPVTSYPYTSNNLTQLFGGFGAGTVLNLSGTSYVDVEGLEITSHNGACSRVGAPAYPATCSTSSPVSDYVTQGISTGDTSADITFQDVYVHGVNSSGFYGSIGGPITMTRVISAFNAFAGYNFDDGNPDGAGSSVTASYVWMEGNGCQEEYPIIHTSFPAVACHDTNSGGFGDSWSGQTTNIDAFSCDHCTTIYNTKDGFIGPHALVKNLSLTHSIWYGNMGSPLKWGTQSSGSTLFENNFVNGNCYAMSVQIPGAGQNFNQSTALGGSYLSGYCRAAGAPFAISTSGGSTFLFAGNTIVSSIANTTLEMSCVNDGTCSSTNFQFADNIFLGYTPPTGYGPFGGGQIPAIYWTDDPTPTDLNVLSNHNLFYGNRNDDCTGGYGGVTLTSIAPVCSDPLLVNEPAQGGYPPESSLINFNFTLGGNSPAIGAGIAVPGLTTDYNNFSRATPPSIGALENGSVYTIPPPPPVSPPPPVTPPVTPPPVSAAASASVRVYPNPWRKDQHTGHPITFDQMTAGSDVKIFTVSGHKVKELNGSSGSVTWDLTNDSGNQVASGVYLYLIKDSQGNKTKGKLAIIQ
jgi:hypothetical protein